MEASTPGAIPSLHPLPPVTQTTPTRALVSTTEAASSHSTVTATATATATATGTTNLSAELHFLIAKLLTQGPFADIGQALRLQLADSKVLPKRLDWEGGEHDQTFDDLERQYPSVTNDHLLSVCEGLLKTPPNRPRKSILCSTLFRKLPQKKPKNVVELLLARSLGMAPTGQRTLRLPSLWFSSIQLQRRTLGHLSAVYCVLFDRTGRYIITGADDLLVKIWSAIDGRLLGTLRGASSEITDMTVDSNNQLLAAGSIDRLIRVWDMQSAAPIAVLQGHSGMITSVHFCPAHAGDLSCLVSTSTDGSVAFWTYSQTNDGRSCFISKPVQYVERIRPGTSKMICAAWSPGGAFLAAGSADHHVRVYMMAESGPKRILEMAAHTDAVDSLQWAHSGLRFVSGSKDSSAIVWQLHATQWRSTKLNMSDTLPGEEQDTDDSRKLKVTMVAWDCMDNYVITAVNDYSLKVWCSHTFKLVRVLKGHKDEVYVIEAHPSHPAVILSAGHDGQIIFWDIIKGMKLGSFFNNIDGQGHGEVYDAKWSPDGTKISATDSHGHILLLGLGKGHPLLEKLPRELFFHTDYRPLVWDAQGGVSDEQTGIPPHLMSAPFLVDVEGNPHPPSVQRLVPGCEYAAFDQLIPDIDGSQDAEVIRSQITEMIEALAVRQAMLLNNDSQNENSNDAHARPSNSGRNHSHDFFGDIPHTSEAAHSGENSRVENSHLRNEIHNNMIEWQRGDQVHRSFYRLIAPLSRSVATTRRLYIEAMTQMEMAWYTREMRRRPLMISTSSGINEKKLTSRRGRARGGPRPPRKTAQPSGREYDEPPEVISPQQSDSDSSVRLSLSDDSCSNTSRSDHSDDSSSSSSSEYSDWVADHPGVPLEPPKRSKRKPARQAQPPQPVETKKEDDGVVIPKIIEVAEAYRPSDWLCSVLPRKAPYYPQMGDECMYFKQGHERYLHAVLEKDVYKVCSKDTPWQKLSLKECESVKVIGIKYVIRPPRLVCLKLALQSGSTFTVRYHDMPDVIDFFVLRQMYEIAVERRWGVEDRFRCMIDDGWWMGTVVEGGVKNGCNSNVGNEVSGSHFLSLRVRWDNGEYEQMSPWDLEPIEESRLPEEVGGWVGVLPSELQNLLYRPRSEEWPGGDRDEACSMIAKGIDQVMGLAIAEPFVAPVDLNVYPTYAYVVEYPIDLSTIKARFENHFYRRVTTAQFDVRYLATNAEKFNKPHTAIVKQARVITELCLQIIRSPFAVNVQEYYHFLMDSYNSTDSDVPLAKQTSIAKANGDHAIKNDWYSSCRTVLKGIIAATDSHPFREPVCLDQFPEYRQIVSKPMDLSTVKIKLENGSYHDPINFGKDIRLIFANSKLYNTNRKSQIYAMTVRLSSLFEALFSPVMDNWKAARRKVEYSRDSDSTASNSDYNTRNTVTRKQMDEKGCTSNGISGIQPLAHVFLKQNYDNQDSDSWDSDVPLQKKVPIVYKGKGKGKRSSSNTNNVPLQIPTRSSKRSNDSIVQNNIQNGYNQKNPSVNQNGLTSDNDSADDRCKDDDSGDSYKPTKRTNGVDAFHNSKTLKKKGKKKKKEHRRSTSKLRNKKPKAKKRKRNIGSENEGSSSDTSVSVASVRSARRYESDHSFQLRGDSASDSDDNTPLENMRQLNPSPRTQLNFIPDNRSRLRERNLTNSDESMPGPSGYSSRVRRTARDSKRPKYNEDSDDDNIAAISKRSRGYQRFRPPNNQNMLSIPTILHRTQLLNANNPSTSQASPGPSGSGRSFQSPNDTFAPEDDEPLSVSSRGRIRKLTAKARNLLRD